jgi:hypothetical protein
MNIFIERVRLFLKTENWKKKLLLPAKPQPWPWLYSSEQIICGRDGRKALSFESDPYRKQILCVMHFRILVRCHVHNPELTLVTE